MMSQNLNNCHSSCPPTCDIEVGIADAIQEHVQRHVVAPKPVSQRRLDLERCRPIWIRDMTAEALGVFLYVYPGLASTATFFLNKQEPAFSSIFQIGMAYALGIAFAIIVCGPTSGGHFNPAITICFAIWHGFPTTKITRYIFAQVVGSFLAGLLLYWQYYPQITVMKQATAARGIVANSLGGPGSILCSFPAANQTNYGYLFMVEFFVCSFIGLVIWACIDPANPFVSPISAPFIIGLAYATMIWGFADATISTNLARDLGTRLVAAIYFGTNAFNRYSVIAIFTNIPATVFGTLIYEIMLKDSFASIAQGHNTHEGGSHGLAEHLSKAKDVNVDFVQANPPDGNYKNGRKEDSAV